MKAKALAAHRPVIELLFSIAAVACSSSTPARGSGGNGTPQGGAVTGGAISVGGVTNSGGSDGSGGSQSVTSASGGTSSGGSSSPNSGGATFAGGAPSGGTRANGGSASVGGATSTGGNANTFGGSMGAGGAVDSGGSTTENPSGIGSCGKENCGPNCTAPTLPAYATLTANPKLPDPFLMTTGNRISKLSDWECRRSEIGAQLQNYELGIKTPKDPGTVSGSYSAGTLTVNVGASSFTVKVTLPTSGTAPYPAIIALDGGSLPTTSITAMGVAIINMSTNAMGDQSSASGRGKGFFFTVNGADGGAGALIAWAWGASRIIDALEVTPAAQIDPKHIGATGCSRNGKGALVIGAFDERVALTIPQESGSGGSASWRISDVEDAGSGKVQTLAEIIGENCWFGTALNQFAQNKAATKLPFDHHELLGMVAPRGLLLIENTDYQWLSVNSCVVDSTAARTIYTALGAKDHMGYTNSGHSHCQFNTAELPYLQAFIKKFLLGQSVDTNIWNVSKSSFGGTSNTVDMSTWVDWTAPTLN